MHVVETHHIGIQCELLLPQATITSTPTKASTGTSKPTISSDISDVDDDINDEGGTDADTTQSTLYEDPISTSEPESALPVEKQQTYLVFESALLVLFSICFICDWICKNRLNCHNSRNPVYCLTL